MDFIEKYKAAFAVSVSNGFSETRIKGMSSVEIEEVEREQGVRIPDSYRKFLEFCGNSQGGVLESENIYSRDLHGIKGAAMEALRDGGDDVSLDGYIVFMMHQGYIFFCMREGSADPSVYGYSSVEGGGLRSEEASFSEFIEYALSEGL
ncbi:SMI1/KNR4 family protein [Streptomyces sp. NPDC051954]|uniref:SMI1/KNR4 family protein n=1 Tax=unclassified Streptomyces TaxID=2593676 RepID=UPI0034248D08